VSFLGVEEVMDAVLARLKAGMATKCAMLQSAYGNTIPLSAPSTTTGYWCEMRPPDTKKAEDFGAFTQPTICIWPLTEEPGERNVPGEYDSKHGIFVGIVLRAATQNESTRAIARYVRAVKEVLCLPGVLVIGTCDWVGTDWRQRDLTPDKADYTFQSALVGFTVTLYDQL
jgi:hypothetical protein